MTTTITQFPLPAGTPEGEIQEALLGIIPEREEAPGLVHKHLLLSEDRTTGGAVYLWESREQARQFTDGYLKERIRSRFGAEPRIEYFETPAIGNGVNDRLLAYCVPLCEPE